MGAKKKLWKCFKGNRNESLSNNMIDSSKTWQAFGMEQWKVYYFYKKKMEQWILILWADITTVCTANPLRTCWSSKHPRIRIIASLVDRSLTVHLCVNKHFPTHFVFIKDALFLRSLGKDVKGRLIGAVCSKMSFQCHKAQTNFFFQRLLILGHCTKLFVTPVLFWARKLVGYEP